MSNGSSTSVLGPRKAKPAHSLSDSQTKTASLGVMTPWSRSISLPPTLPGWNFPLTVPSSNKKPSPVDSIRLLKYREKAYQVGIGWKQHTSMKVSYSWYSQKCQIHLHYRSSWGREDDEILFFKVTHPAACSNIEGCLKYDTYFIKKKISRDCAVV